MSTPTENGLGLQSLLRSGESADHPVSFAETPGGLLLMANGVDPMVKWDGLATSADEAGVKPPGTAAELGGTGLGAITGKLVAYVRFLDGAGNASDLSPASNVADAGRDGFVEDATFASGGVVTVRSDDHGLATGDAVRVSGADCLPLLNGDWYVAVVDKDTFTLAGLSIPQGFYTGGAVWTMGVETVAYGAVPVPSQGKVVRRQILRNLAGNLEALYVDIDTTDLVSTAFFSRATDAALATGTAVPMTYGEDDLPFAGRHGVPPAHKAVIASHKGRIFATADATYSAGHAEARFNSTRVQGVGTAWRKTFAGRLIYIDGATRPYGIADVDEAAQVATLDAPYLEAPRPFAAYTVQPEPGERRLVYYSEPGLPESWPAYNALAVPETDDEIVGITSFGQYLYVIERRHIHRLTNTGDPQDGHVFLSARRGSVNNRTYAEADGALYLLDEMGIHRFDEQVSTSISGPVQNLFQNDGAAPLSVDWAADRTLWHAAADAVHNTIRWFVQMAGYDGLRHAICYHYLAERWWLEEYPTPMTASCEATFGARRSLCGAEGRRVLCLGEGSYDGVRDAADATLRGTVTSATATTLTDSSASFASVEGAPVTVVEGTGRGQTRIVATGTADTLEVVEPWDTTPDGTSVYQIGGVPWYWRSGWFRYVDAEEDTARDVEIVFHPLAAAHPGALDFQLYFDHDTEPRVWARTIDQDGVRTVDGDPHITVDLTSRYGWARQRTSGHAGTYSFGDTFVSVEMSGVQAGEPLRISQVVLNGVEVG